jgi:citrate lyase beta subunit
MRARRALLYTPGDDPHKIRKAANLDVDCVCLDIEDGVALNRKNIARETIAELLPSLEFGRTERLVRINPVESASVEDDLRTIIPVKPDGIVVPKVETGKQVKWVSDQISNIEEQYNWPSGSIILIVIIESALALVNLREITTATNRLEALILGAEDLAADLGAERSQSGWEVFFARSAIVTYAAAYGLQAIDLVNIDFQDLSNLRVQANQGAKMGFAGKQVIHPDQVHPVQQAFTPNEEQIAQSKKLLEEFKLYQEAGRGAFAVDGKMIDAPLIKSAQGILERARAAGKI